MNYYVVLPDVWYDGKIKIKSLIDFMCRSHVVCMGWDEDRNNGWNFANSIHTGDCVIVARRRIGSGLFSLLELWMDQLSTATKTASTIPCAETLGLSWIFVIAALSSSARA